MAEQLTPVAIATYRVVRLLLDFLPAHIEIDLLTSTNEHRQFAYNGATATALMIALNKADLSTSRYNAASSNVWSRTGF